MDLPLRFDGEFSTQVRLGNYLKLDQEYHPGGIGEIATVFYQWGMPDRRVLTIFDFDGVFVPSPLSWAVNQYRGAESSLKAGFGNLLHLRTIAKSSCDTIIWTNRFQTDLPIDFFPFFSNPTIERFAKLGVIVRTDKHRDGSNFLTDRFEEVGADTIFYAGSSNADRAIINQLPGDIAQVTNFVDLNGWLI